MKKAVSTTIFGLLWLALSVGASATTLYVESQNFPVGSAGGGGFLADLTGNAADSFEVYCVDYRNEVNLPDNFYVNIDTPSLSLADTRYGTTTNFYWNSLVAGVPSTSSSGAQFGNDYDRYVMAGWLTTQYDHSNGWSALDIGIQEAIWTLLDVDGTSFADGDVDAELAAAVHFMHGNSAAFALLGSEIEIFTATVIGGNTNLDLASGGNRYSVGQQELLTVESSVPEPAVFVLVGCGLVALGVIRRRRYK
jgi:hypothetical protein